MGGDDHRDLAGQTQAVADEAFLGHIIRPVLQRGERADGGAEDVHRMPVLHLFDDVVNSARQLARFDQTRIPRRQLVSGRQFAIDKEV